MNKLRVHGLVGIDSRTPRRQYVMQFVFEDTSMKAAAMFGRETTLSLMTYESWVLQTLSEGTGHY